VDILKTNENDGHKYCSTLVIGVFIGGRIKKISFVGKVGSRKVGK